MFPLLYALTKSNLVKTTECIIEYKGSNFETKIFMPWQVEERKRKKDISRLRDLSYPGPYSHYIKSCLVALLLEDSGTILGTYFTKPLIIFCSTSVCPRSRVNITSLIDWETLEYLHTWEAGMPQNFSVGFYSGLQFIHGGCKSRNYRSSFQVHKYFMGMDLLHKKIPIQRITKRVQWWLDALSSNHHNDVLVFESIQNITAFTGHHGHRSALNSKAIPTSHCPFPRVTCFHNKNEYANGTGGGPTREEIGMLQ